MIMTLLVRGCLLRMMAAWSGGVIKLMDGKWMVKIKLCLSLYGGVRLIYILLLILHCVINTRFSFHAA